MSISSDYWEEWVDKLRARAVEQVLEEALARRLVEFDYLSELRTVLFDALYAPHETRPDIRLPSV